MLEYLHTKRLWLVRVKFLENGLYLLCNVLTELSPEKAQSTKTLEISRVFAIFTVNFVAKTQGTKLAVFLIPPDSNRRKL